MVSQRAPLAPHSFRSFRHFSPRGMPRLRTEKILGRKQFLCCVVAFSWTLVFALAMGFLPGWSNRRAN